MHTECYITAVVDVQPGNVQLTQLTPDNTSPTLTRRGLSDCIRQALRTTQLAPKQHGSAQITLWFGPR